MLDGYFSPLSSSPSASVFVDSVTTNRRGSGTVKVRNPYKSRTRPVPVSEDRNQSGDSTLDRLNLARYNGERLFSPERTTANVHQTVVPSSINTLTASLSQDEIAQGRSTSPKSVIEKDEDDTRLPQTLGAMHKFYALLLRNSIPELLQAAPGERNGSDAVDETGEKLLAKMRGIVDLPMPTQRLKANYNTPREHMQSRAALVLEEGRYTLCQDLYNLRLTKIKPAFTIEMELVSQAEEEEFDIPISDAKKKVDTPTVFRSSMYDQGWFTPDVMTRLIPGLIVQCTSNDGSIELLGVVSSNNSRLAMAKQGVLEILFYDPSLVLPSGSNWELCPVGSSHINSAREFAAVMEYENLVPFFDVIRGVQVPAQPRMAGSNRNDDSNGGKTNKNGTDPCATESKFQLPILNRSQETASSIFLDSPEGSVTIVQGYVLFTFIIFRI